MHLNDEERAMLAGEFGEPRRMAPELQIRGGYHAEPSLHTGDTVSVVPDEGLVRVESSETARGMTR